MTSITPAALAAKKATTTIPIVMVNKDPDARMQDRFETSVRRLGLENLDASKPASKSSV